MGEMVEFASNGGTCHGYLATPSSPGPGVIVIQEWWGLVDHIKDLTDRFAAEGFVALAPDLYHGKTSMEPDEAGKLLMALKLEEAGKDMAGAHDYLLARDDVSPKKAGVTGFCAGGNLAYQLAAMRPTPAVPFYPYPFLPWPDPASIHEPVLFQVGAHDDAPTVATIQQLVDELQAAGKDADYDAYSACHHAFFNDSRPEVYQPEAAEDAWKKMLGFFREHLA